MRPSGSVTTALEDGCDDTGPIDLDTLTGRENKFTADKIIIEGRNRLNSLRSEHLSDSELIAAMLDHPASALVQMPSSGIVSQSLPRMQDIAFIRTR